MNRGTVLRPRGNEGSCNGTPRAQRPLCMHQEPNSPRHPLQHMFAGATALMAAAGRGRLETLRLLLAHGADVTARSQDGSSAAGWARMFGHADVAAELEQHEQQVNEEDHI